MVIWGELIAYGSCIKKEKQKELATLLDKIHVLETYIRQTLTLSPTTRDTMIKSLLVFGSQGQRQEQVLCSLLL